MSLSKESELKQQHPSQFLKSKQDLDHGLKALLHFFFLRLTLGHLLFIHKTKSITLVMAR